VRYAPTRRSYPPLGHLDRPLLLHASQFRLEASLRSFQLARVVLVLMLVLMLVLVARGIDADDFVIERRPEFISFFNQLHFMLQRLAQRLVIRQGFSVSGQTGYFHAIFRPPVTTLQRNGHDHTAVIADAKKDKQVE